MGKQKVESGQERCKRKVMSTEDPKTIPIDRLVGAIGGQPKGEHRRTEYRTPVGTLSVSPEATGGGTFDKFHFWGGPFDNRGGRGAVQFAEITGLFSGSYPQVCEWLIRNYGEGVGRPPSLVAQAQAAQEEKYLPPQRIFDLRQRTDALMDYLCGQRGLPPGLIRDLARQERGPLAVGYGPKHGHYLIFPLRNHADPRKPEVGAILRWRDAGPPTLYGGKKAPKAAGTDSVKGWWQVGPYPAPTTIITEAPIDALSIWAALTPKDREHTRIIATGGEGGLKASGVWAGSERVFLAQDRDPAGHKQALKAWRAAYDAAARCPISRLLPPLEKDWNAAWQADPTRVREVLSAALEPTPTHSPARGR